MKSFINRTLIEAAKLLNNEPHQTKMGGENKSNRYGEQILTEQDVLVESFIINKIQEQYPNTNIISEEKLKNEFVLVDPTWIIDPIDGSMNYYRGLNHYCLSLSYWERNEPQIASVYSPYNGQLFHASRGQGATLNEKKIRVSDIADLKDAIVLLSGFNSFSRQDKEKQFYHLVNEIKNMRVLSSSVLDICYVASGKCDARILSNSKFWDIAAAKLILEEAGGCLTDWQADKNKLFSAFILASNKQLHKPLLELLHA